MSAQDSPVQLIMVQNLQTKKLDLLLKKRNYEWSNEIFVAADSRGIQLISYGDRFIPRRLLLRNLDKNGKLSKKEILDDPFLTAFSLHRWKQHRLTFLINQSFGIKDHRILNFSDEILTNSSIFLNSKSAEFIYGRTNCYDWSCKPRLKPSAHSDATHDLPGFDFLSNLNLVDWSNNDQIVASFGREIVVWKRKEDLNLIFNIKFCRAISYGPSGNLLAVGCKNGNNPALEIWNTMSLRNVVVVNKTNFDQKHFSILSIEWSKSEKEIVCGTNSGTIYALAVPQLNILHKIQKHQLPVTIIKFSPNMRYLACGDTDGNISIYNWSSCETHCFLTSHRKLKISFDWHPWNDVDLAISQETPAMIVILHVPKIEVVAYYQRKDKRISFDAVTFSKLTGELLVSVSENGNDGCIYSEIVVMSSLDRVVDVLRIPESGVRFMMWSPDGKKLASAGHDETLTFWNFCSEKSIHKIPNKFKLRCRNIKKPLEVDFGLQFNMWSSLK